MNQLPALNGDSGARSNRNVPLPPPGGTLLVVRAIDPMVRPWKPPSKAMTACRPVAARAILTALSTASPPLGRGGVGRGGR